MLEIKSKIYESFMKTFDLSQVNMLTIDSVILKNYQTLNLNEFKSYNSLLVRHCKSLVDELTFEQTNFLREILNNPKQVQLLYRGS